MQFANEYTPMYICYPGEMQRTKPYKKSVPLCKNRSIIWKAVVHPKQFHIDYRTTAANYTI